MSRLWRSAIIVGLLAAALVAGASIAYTPARIVKVTDAAGGPVAGAVVAYHHHQSIFNFVDSLGRDEPGALLVTGPDGRAHVPARWGLKWPLDGMPVVIVSFVFAADLHNAVDGGLEGGAIPGVMSSDPANDTVTLFDLSGDPERWSESLWRLLSAIRYEFWPSDGPRRVMVAPDDLARLVEAVAAEHRALRERYPAAAAEWDERVADLMAEWREARGER